MLQPFDPARSDYVLRLIHWLLPNNPFLITISYSALSFGGTILAALIAGSAWSVQNSYVELFEDYANIINFGIVLPAGVWLVLHLYSCVKEGFTQIIADGVICFKDVRSGERFLNNFDTSINRRWFFWIALGLSILYNAYSVICKHEAWNDLYGGLPAWWFRIFSIVNFCILFHIGFKALVVVYTIRNVFTKRIVLQPLHPDGCGGLRSLGNISLALNYLICLVAIYISILAFVARTPLQSPLFLPVVISFMILAVYMFFVPLAKAHDIMEREKKLILSILNKDFQSTYTKIAAELDEVGISLQDAQKIEALERLYRIASRMPVWPLDTKIIIQFLAAVALPLAIGLTVELTKHWLP